MAQNSQKLKILRPPMQEDRVEDMQSSLWSRLPWELVTLIITHTTCQETQNAWCLAIHNRSRQLNHVAMKTRWSSITIDDRDILPGPGDDYARFNELEERLEELNISQGWKPIVKTLQALLTTNDRGRCPANYVDRVVFDFRMLRYVTYEIRNVRELEPWEMMPSLETAMYTLSKLHQHFRSLTHIICYGDTPKELLDWISKYVTGVQVLLLRGLGSFGALYIPYEAQDWDNRANYASRKLPLDMSSLSILQQLVHLDIHRLSSHEIQAMKVSLPRLINLQTLVIACDKAEHDDQYVCAFDRLLSTVPETKQNEPMIWLPSSLKHLSMINTYDEFRKMDLPANQYQCLDFPDSLEHLNLDLAKLSLAIRVLDRIQMANLKFLAVPEYCTQALEYYVQKQLYGLAQQSEKGVQSLRLIRAWDFDNNHLASLRPLQELYAVNDLVLGTRNPDWYQGFLHSWRERVPIPTLSDYLYGFHWYGSERKTGMWGGTLKRVRVDHIHVVQDLDISMLSSNLWKELKILMLQPAPRDLPKSIWRHGMKLVKEAVCDELVQRIVLCASQSLCVVVISTQWYWIARDPDANLPRIWSWTAAKCDALQSSSMQRTFDQRDVDFLDNKDVPYWCERDTIEWHRAPASNARTHPHSPDHEMVHHGIIWTCIV